MKNFEEYLKYYENLILTNIKDFKSEFKLIENSNTYKFYFSSNILIVEEYLDFENIDVINIKLDKFLEWSKRYE